jgi:hypothetical protein
MADPRTTPQLDDFNRADENPLSNSGMWGEAAGDRTQMRLITDAGVKHIVRQVNELSYSLYLPQAFSGDVEVWGRRYEGGSAIGHNERMDLVANAPYPTLAGYWTGYSVWAHTQSDGNHFYLWRYTNGSRVQLSNIKAEGNYVFLRTFGNLVQTWIAQTAVDDWTLLQSVTDTNHRTNLRPVFGEGDNNKLVQVTTGWRAAGGGQPSADDFVPQIYRRTRLRGG